MQTELVQLQWITLGSIAILIVLCGLLLLVVWLFLNLSGLTERLRATLIRFTTEARSHGDGKHSHLSSGDMAFVTEELDWSRGSGHIVPIGAVIRLLALSPTSSGSRWSAHWHGSYLWPIPPESLRRATAEEITIAL